ncbi:hypothetical protein [Bradyrhizobium sp. 6(2017)]|nr:hypothetical protein [Bradyrhizobium sp. 6(2017)]
MPPAEFEAALDRHQEEMRAGVGRDRRRRGQHHGRRRRDQANPGADHRIRAAGPRLMGKVFDGADYERKLDAARNGISTSEEARFVITGDLAGLNARKAFQEAKERALMKARKKMLDRIEQEQADHALNDWIPTEVEEIVTGPNDEIVSVDG